MELHKALEYKHVAFERSEEGLKVYPTEEILGDMTVTKDFAAFYAKHKLALDIAASSFLLDFTELDEMPAKKAFMLCNQLWLAIFRNSDADAKTYTADQKKP